MPSIHLQKLSETTSPLSAWSVIQRDENSNFIVLCHTKHNTLTDSVHRICTDVIVEENTLTHGDHMKAFTNVLEQINQELSSLYLRYKKSEVSIFIWLLVEKNLHFSVFWKDLTGIISSSRGAEDIFVDMDTGEWHFVYDSHGDIKEDETLYLFSPKVDTHLLNDEFQDIRHLPISERGQLLAERLHRSYNKDGVILVIGSSTEEDMEWKWWEPQESKRYEQGKMIFGAVRGFSEKIVKNTQKAFVHLSKNTQNWVVIAGIVVSVVLLYFVITSLIRSQYTIFVPQKYRDTLAEARVNLDDATRMIDQPEAFSSAISKVKSAIQTVKDANVLKVDVAQLESDIAVLEKSVNKVTTLANNEYKPIYSFSKNIDSLPFSIHIFDSKISLVTTNTIIGPFVAWENPTEYTIPNGEKFTFSDMNSDGRIFFWTNQDRIYIFDKGIFSTQNIQQVGGWDKAVDISAYNSNIYLLSGDRKQIYRHRLQSENTYSGRGFIITDTQTRSITDIDVDGSVWMFWWSGGNVALEKILTAPKYERRGIVINGLGTNTFNEINPDTTKIYADADFSELYILANNRIWIFAPNSRRFNDVQFVTYVGQIDVPNVIITDMAIEQNGDVRNIYFWSPKSGIYTAKINIVDNKIHILPSE